MQIQTWYWFRCARALPELAALVLARQGQKQDAPVCRVRNDSDIRKRVNVQSVLQRSGKGQAKRQIGIGRSRRRQGQHRPDLLAKEIGYRYRVAGGIGADQRARQIVVGNRSRIDANFEGSLNGTYRVDDIDRVSGAGICDEASGRIGRGAVAVRSAIGRHRIINHRSRAVDGERLGLAARTAIGDADEVTAGIGNGYLMVDVVESHGDRLLARRNTVGPSGDGIYDRHGVGHAVGDGNLARILIGGRAYGPRARRNGLLHG